MPNKESNLVKNTLLFSVGNAGAKLLMLIIVPLYTYYVSVNQMGDYDLVHTYTNLFAPLACAALFEGIYRWLLDSKSSRADTIKTGYVLAFACMAVFDVIVFAALKAINYNYLWEFLLVADSQCLYSMTQFTTRGLRNNKTYAVQGIVYSVILILSNILMVILLRWQARGLLYSVFAANMLTSVAILASQKTFGNYFRKGKVQKSLAKDLFKYSLPIVPNNIAWWLVSGSNRAIINWALGSVGNGIYAIALKFPTILNMLSTFFYQAWQEQAITEYDSAGRDAYYTKILNIYIKLLLTGSIALIPVSKFIIMFFMEPSYRSAYHYVGILYLSSVFNALAAFYGTGYLSSKKTAGAFTTTIYGAVANVLISLLLINTVGLFAAALGNMFGNLLIWIVRSVQTKKYFKIKINFASFFSLLALCTVFIVIVDYANLPALILTEAAAGILFLILNRDMVLGLFNMYFRRKA